jgi:hypothetical protein
LTSMGGLVLVCDLDGAGDGSAHETHGPIFAIKGPSHHTLAKSKDWFRAWKKQCRTLQGLVWLLPKSDYRCGLQ